MRIAASVLGAVSVLSGCTILFPYWISYEIQMQASQQENPGDTAGGQEVAHYSDDQLQMEWRLSGFWFSVRVTNLSDEPLLIRWDQASIVETTTMNVRVTDVTTIGAKVPVQDFSRVGPGVRRHFDLRPAVEPELDSYGFDVSRPPFGIHPTGAQPAIGRRSQRAVGREVAVRLPLEQSGRAQTLRFDFVVTGSRLNAFQ